LISKSQALILIGSPRGQRSTSASLGHYLADGLGKNGFETQWLLAHKAVRDAESRAALMTSVEKAGLMILAFPLYVDCLPYPVIRALEVIAAQTQYRDAATPQRLVALVNCGFPESLHNDTALAICRQFAHETGRLWAGGLALGEGGVIDGQPLIKVEKRVRNVILALDLAVEALSQDRVIPQEAKTLMAKPLVPGRLYRMIASLNFMSKALRRRQFTRLWQRPFDPDGTSHTEK
jgi:hypothetical protein